MAATTSPFASGDRGRHRRDPHRELVVDPGVSGERDRPEPLADGGRIRDGPLGQGGGRLGQVSVDGPRRADRRGTRARSRPRASGRASRSSRGSRRGSGPGRPPGRCSGPHARPAPTGRRPRRWRPRARRDGAGRSRSARGWSRGRTRAPRSAGRAGSGCRRAPARPRPRRASDASIRAAVDFGRSARSATSVTPTGPSVNAASTANARSMDWTLDTALPRGLNSRPAFHHTAPFHDVEPATREGRSAADGCRAGGQEHEPWRTTRTSTSTH